MASKRSERQQEVSFRVMRLVQEDPFITTREIAEKVGISNGAAYYCVNALVEKGFVKLKNFTKTNSKTNILYELTPDGMRSKAAMTVKFLELKKAEYNNLRAEIKRLENELDIYSEKMVAKQRASE